MSKNYSLNPNTNTFSDTQSNNTCLVRRGETACAIARNHGLSLKELQKLNPGVDLNNIKAGQKLKYKEDSKLSSNKAISSTKTSSTFTTKGCTQQTKTSLTPLFGSKTSNNSDCYISFNKKTVSNPTKTSQVTSKQQIYPAAISPKKADTTKDNGILTLKKYEENMLPETKRLKPFIKKKEGKVTSIYIAPEGKATIGHGHLLINKPQFLRDIEKQDLSHTEKDKLVQKALLKNENKIALKQAFQKDLLDAIKTTGIKNIPSTVNNDLVFSNDQIELLFCSDVKKAQDAMIKVFGKDVLSKRTVNQKLVVLDLCFNSGGNLNKKSPEFVKQFKAGNMDKAQAELNIFRSDNKILLGLIRRCYNRMLLLNDNQLSPLAQTRLLAASNEYLKTHDKELAKNFIEVEKILKKS